MIPADNAKGESNPVSPYRQRRLFDSAQCRPTSPSAPPPGCPASGPAASAGNRGADIDANHVTDRAATRVAFAEDAAVTAAIAHRHYQLGVGRAVVGDAQRVLHVLRHRAGDQQHVGVARADDELDAAAFEVVVGIVQRMDFQLAGVAGAGGKRKRGKRGKGAWFEFSDSLNSCPFFAVFDARSSIEIAATSLAGATA